MYTSSSGNCIDIAAVISAAGLEAASRHALRASHHQQQQQHRPSQLRRTSSSTRSDINNSTHRTHLSPERHARSSQSQGRQPDLSRRVTSPAAPWTPPSPGPGVGEDDDLAIRPLNKAKAEPRRHRSKSSEDVGLAHPISLLDTAENGTIDEGDEDERSMRTTRSTTDGRPSEADSRDSAPPSTSGSFRQRSSAAHALTQPTPIVIALEPSTHVIAIGHNSPVFPSTTAHGGGAAASRKRNIPNKSYHYSHGHTHKPKPKRSHNSLTNNRAPSTTATAAAAAAAALAAASAVVDGAAAVLVTRPDLGGIVVGAGPVPGLTLGSSTSKDATKDTSKLSRTPGAAASTGRGLSIGRRLSRVPATSIAAAAASAARAAAAVAVSNGAISTAAPVWPLARGRSVQLHHHESFMARGPGGQLSAEATAASEVALLTSTVDSLTAVNHEGFGLRRQGTDLLQLELLGAGRSQRGLKASKGTQSPSQSPPRRQCSQSSSRGRSGGSSPRSQSAPHIATVRHMLPNSLGSEYSLIRLDRDPSRISVVDSSTRATNPFSIDLPRGGHRWMASPQHSTNVFGIGNGLAADPSTLNSDLGWYPEVIGSYSDGPLPSIRSAPHLLDGGAASAGAGVSSGDDEADAVARGLQYGSAAANNHRTAPGAGAVLGASLGGGVDSGRAQWSVPGGGSLRPSMSMPILPSQPSPDRAAARGRHARTVAGGGGGFDISGCISLEELAEEWNLGSRPRPNSYPAPPVVVAVAPLVPPAAEDPELNEAVAKARRRAAEEKQKRRAAAAVAAAARAAKAKAAAAKAAKAALLAGRPQGSTTMTVASVKPSEQAESVSGNLTSRGSSKAAIAQVLFHHQAEDWARTRRQLPPRRRLPPDVTKMVEKWFALVDEDNSGKLQARELATALRGAGLPCSESDIMDLVRSIDADHDGCISLSEFQSFLLRELGEGKNLTEGDYVLPSGKRLPFGAMIARLKRLKVLDDVMKGGKARNRYVDMLYNRHGTGNEIGLLPEEAAANLNALGGSGADFGGNDLAAAAAGAGRGGRVRLQTLFQQYRLRQQEALAPLLAVAEEPPPVLYPPLSYDASDSDSDLYGDGSSGTAPSGPFRSATRSVREMGPPGWASGEDGELDSDAIAVAAGFGEAVAGVSYFPRRSSSVSMLQSACSIRHREARGNSIPAGSFAHTVTAEPGDRTLVFQLTEVGLTQEVSSNNTTNQPNNSPSARDDSAADTTTTAADNGGNEDAAAPAPSDNNDDTDADATTTTAAITSGPSAVPAERSEGGSLTARSGPPAPLIPALPPVPRPNTRAFARALLDMRQCAPEYLVQRYGMPGPREAAAAAAAAGGSISPRSGSGTVWGRQGSSNGFENSYTTATGSLRPLVATAPPGAIADGLYGTARSNGAAGAPDVPGTALADVEGSWTLKSSGSVTAQSEGTFPTASAPHIAATNSSAVLAATGSGANFTAYGAGFTRYKRWTMYEIDPAAENPDYWQAKAAALLMRRTRKAFRGVPHSGFAIASAAAAAAATVAAGEAAARDLDLLGSSSSVAVAAAAAAMDSGAAVAGVPETFASAATEAMMLPGVASSPPSRVGGGGTKPVFHLPTLPLTGSSHTSSAPRFGDVTSSSKLRAESSRLHVPALSTGTPHHISHHVGLGPAAASTASMAALAGSSTTGVSGVHGHTTGCTPRNPHLTDRPVADTGGPGMGPHMVPLSPARLKRNLSRGHAGGVSSINDGCPVQYVVRPQHGAPARLPGAAGESPRRRRPPPAPPGGAAAAAAAAPMLMMTVGGSVVESPSSPPHTAPQSPSLRQSPTLRQSPSLHQSPSKRNLPSPCMSSPLPLVQQPSPQRRWAISLPPLVAAAPAPAGPPK